MLHLCEAFPCRSLNANTGAMHVELDPLAEVQVRQAIEDKQMRVVGWYHSHPIFAPQPSLRDVQNQTNYQYLFHDPLLNMMPFIGNPTPTPTPTPTPNPDPNQNWNQNPNPNPDPDPNPNP